MHLAQPDLRAPARRREFLGELARRAGAFTVGHGSAEGTTMGPLIDGRALAKVERHLEDALAQGRAW
ncbi:aldehyde dehydrogenase family protein [Streptomyces sp. M10(2022)]